MFGFILLSKKHNGKTEQFLLHTLRNHFSVTALSGNRITHGGQGQEALFLTLPTLKGCCMKNAVLILEPGMPVSGMPEGITVIVSSEETQQLKALSTSPVQTITCGLSSKDTVTFSSNSEDTAVISLLREIERVDNLPQEPMDVPVTFPQGTDGFSLLAATAALILTGKIATP